MVSVSKPAVPGRQSGPPPMRTGEARLQRFTDDFGEPVLNRSWGTWYKPAGACRLSRSERLRSLCLHGRYPLRSTPERRSECVRRLLE